MQESYFNKKVIEDNFIVDGTLGRDIKLSIELTTASTFEWTLTSNGLPFVHNTTNTKTDFFRKTWTELGVCII